MTHATDDMLAVDVINTRIGYIKLHNNIFVVTIRLKAVYCKTCCLIQAMDILFTQYINIKCRKSISLKLSQGY